MIRFLPDTWRDAIWRPLSMASPDGGVYVEIIAPDFRFAFVLVLALAWLVLARGKQRGMSAPVVLLLFTALAFVPWLLTTGNGRYFIPFLLLAGPLCIGLLQLIPVTPSFRLALALGMVLWQSFLIYDVSPWGSWGHVPWTKAPAFGVDVPPEVAAQPATYVTLSSISYSLIAPQFHPASRWINVSTMQGVADKSPDSLRAQALIASPGLLRTIFPTAPDGHESGHIEPALAQAINELLARHALSIEDEAQCRLLRSQGLSSMVSVRQNDAQFDKPVVHGFWLCPLARHAIARTSPSAPLSQRSEQVFARLEGLCPRIFRSGEVASMRIPSGAVRAYPGSDFKLYVFENGEVWYKYVRALNPVRVGNAEAILDPAFTMECNNIRGRSGLPWERGI
jgi:hypothetical protein